ncbi:hypothetical protein [Sphingobium sp. TomTYG45]
MFRNANTYAYHVCIAGQGGLPMVEPVWASQEQNSFDPATSTPLPFIMGVDLSHEHEGRIFDDKGDCIQTFAFNVEPMAGGWVDKHGVAAFNERQSVVLEFQLEMEEAIDWGNFILNPIAYVRHGGCFLDAIEINGKLCMPLPATVN